MLLEAAKQASDDLGFRCTRCLGDFRQCIFNSLAGSLALRLTPNGVQIMRSSTVVIAQLTSQRLPHYGKREF